jgi:hypothetical protein
MAKRKKKESNFKILITILFIIISIVILFGSLLFYLKPLETRIIDLRFTVADHPAFDLNNSILAFGKVPPESNAVRNVILENRYNFPVEVKFFASKNIVNFLQADSIFVIGALNISKFSVNLKVPNNTDFGDYSGKVMFEIRKMRD